MDIDTAHWLYSATAQTFGAILGVVGMLVVYRLSALRTSRWDVMKWCEKCRVSLWGDDAFDQSANEFRRMWLDFKRSKIVPHWVELNEYDEKHCHGKLDAAEQKLEKLLQMQSDIIFRFKWFIVINLVMILGSLLGLKYSSYTVRGEFVAELTVLAIVVALIFTGWLCLVLIPSGKIHYS